jgi:hypothetical protein
VGFAVGKAAVASILSKFDAPLPVILYLPMTAPAVWGGVKRGSISDCTRKLTVKSTHGVKRQKVQTPLL